jgi:hypothetical protein
MSRIVRVHIAMIAVVSMVLVIGGAGAAYAFWTSGSGSGSSTAGTANMQTVAVAAFVGGDNASSTLVPGGSAADVIVRVNNPNSFSVQVVSIVSAGSITADAAHPACTTTGVTFTPPAAPISPTVTVAPNSALLVHLPGAASMDSSSSSGCQGATFHIPVTLAAQR